MHFVHTLTLALPISTFKQKSPICPACGKGYNRYQDVERHFQSFHLPCWIFCPYPGCRWRGSRPDDFDKHFDLQKCGSKPKVSQCQIYNIKMVLNWIKDQEGDDIVSAAQNLAVELVKERAMELERQEWLGDPWGYSAETQARRQRAESRR
jgi:hypothetical protein